MKFPKRLSIILALLVTVATLSAGQEGRANPTEKHGEPLRPMTPAEYQQFLGTLKTDLARWQSQLAEIDLGPLGLDFKQGKMIEKELSCAKGEVDSCLEFGSRLQSQQTLGDNVRLYSCMEGLAGGVSDTQDELNWLGRDSKARLWADELLVVLKEVEQDTTKQFGHVLALADIADASCPELRRYLH